MTTDKCADLIQRLATRIMVIEASCKKLVSIESDEDKKHFFLLNGAIEESMQHVRSLQIAIHEK